MNIHNSKILYAGFWRRFVAYIIDAFVINIFVIVGALVLFFISGKIGLQIEIIREVASWPWLICYLLYSSVMESSSEQATLGKIIMGLKVTDMDGNRITFLRALGRNAGKLLSAIILFIGFIMAAFTTKKQALHDLISGCLVVKYRKSKLWLSLFICFLSLLVIFAGIAAYIYWIKLPAWKNLYKDTFSRLEKTTEPSNKPALPEQINSEEKVPVKLNEAEYDSLLTSRNVDFESGTRISVGPAAFQLSNFWGNSSDPHVWLKVRLIQLPNMMLADNKFAKVLITHVWDQNHRDVYNKDSQFEEKVFQGLNFFEVQKPMSYMEAIRDIHLISGVKENDIEAIEGYLDLKLPINIETADFDLSNIGKQINIAGAKVSLNAINNSEVLLNYEGVIENYINTFAYNDQGKQLQRVGSSTQGTENTISFKNLYKGSVKTIKVVVASKFMERKYPFVLKK